MLRRILLASFSYGVVFSITCNFGYQDIGDGFCYKTYPFAASNINGEIECEQDNANLVVPGNVFTNNLVLNDAILHKVDVWLGILCTTTTASECTLFNGNSFSSTAFQNFLPGHPNPSIGGCVYLAYSGTYAGKWHSAPCDSLKGFGCLSRNSTNGVIRCGSSYSEFGGNCYKFIQPPFESTADEACNLDCGRTTSIESSAENEFVRSLGAKNGRGFVMIGLLLNYTTNYYWSNGNRLAQGNYSNFGLANPNYGSCMAMSLNGDVVQKGTWISSDCGNKIPAICKRALRMPCALSPPPTAAYAPQCPPTTFLEFGKMIYSPGFPLAHFPITSCEYALNGDPDQILCMQFIEYYTGTFLFYNSITDGQPFLTTSRVSEDPYLYCSNSPSMKVKYTGSRLFRARSFLLKKLSSGCNQGILNTPTKITSPNYPLFYNNNEWCGYLINAPKGKRVRFYVDTFETESCCDFVQVYDGSDNNARLLANYSGSNVADHTLTSTSNSMFVVFQSDGKNVESGFKAQAIAF